GFDIDIYPGDCEVARHIPYLDFEEEADMLMELADHAIQDYNNRETTKGWNEVAHLKGEERSTQAEIVGKERQGLGFIQWNFRSRPTQVNGGFSPGG
ncbi:hypothetical protein HAX54_029059, partial [Datura stramonium]|nr:hypothetical protein [Datura stramonium]